MKPGFTTSEFWITVSIILMASILTVVILFKSHTAWEKTQAALPVVIAFLKAHSYAAGRVKQKIEQMIEHKPEKPPEPQPVPPTPVCIPVVKEQLPQIRYMTVEKKVGRKKTILKTTVAYREK